jgi:hypothetical protein
MPDYADLEIGLHRRDGVTWAVETRFSQPGSDADVRLSAHDACLVTLDLDKLREIGDETEEYGRELGRGLLGHAEVDEAFRQAKAAAASRGRALRVRLFVGPSAPELHALRWETLRDPADDSTILTNENVLFSRYLSSLDWRPVGVRPRRDLSALVVVASPDDLATFDVGRPLDDLDVEAELARARTALQGMVVTELPGAAAPTPDHLVDHLRTGCDVLYLVCHGYVLRGGGPQILLEDDSGAARRLDGADLVERLRELRRPPRLVVLASCQSAGRGEHVAGDGGALAALGPRLAEAGVPAVIAMQGDVSVSTVSSFMPAFFQELLVDGQIDRAVAVARGAVRDRVDWWAPTLYMRLKSGRIWYTPGFTSTGFDKWPSLLDDIRDGLCLPILGSGVTDTLLGSRREIAQRWASTFNFPMAPYHRENLPQVAQYLSVNQNTRFPRNKLMEYLRVSLLERYGKHLPDDVREGPLERLVAAAWTARYGSEPDNPLTVLARLPFPVYVSTHVSNLLADALRAEGREPVVELCRWTDDVRWPESVLDSTPDYRPSPERPLVYHLFGHLRMPESVVLTEDNYFDYLINVSEDKDRIPLLVRRAFADRGLLFLGFRLEEWDFRILFRSIMKQEGSVRRDEYTNVAVQIDPEEGRTLEPAGARNYLERYFEGRDISVYWGSSDDFLRELNRAWTRRAA